MLQTQQTKQQRLAFQRRFADQLALSVKPTPYPINVKLANNPFIKNEDKFKFIVYHLSEYNKRVEKGQVSDPYEIASYHKLHSMISDLAQLDTRDDQIQALGQVHEWYKEQHRLVDQRRDQGNIRYEMTSQYRKYITDPPQKKQPEEQAPDKYSQIPTALMNRILQPFARHNRTAHKQLDIPIRRLNQYKRKMINIAPFIADTKSQKQPERVLYPMPPKYEPPKDDDDGDKEEDGEDGGEGHKQDGQKQGVVGGQLALPEGQQQIAGDGNENKQEQVVQPDYGGFGEQPGQPDDDEPPEDVPGEDKLAPKTKLYTSAVSKTEVQPALIPNRRRQYIHYRGSTNSERSLENRYLKLQQQVLSKQRQDKLNMQIATDRARNKSKLTKQMQKRLEDMIHNPRYQFSQQQPEKPQRLSKQDQHKFGFTVAVRSKPRHSQFDLSNISKTAQLLLPKIKNHNSSNPTGYSSNQHFPTPNNQEVFHQNSFKRDRIKSLKSKFSKMLNITAQQESQSRENIPVSMCQYSPRKRNFSQFIRRHSKSKERLGQLDQVSRIKERLTRNKIGVNIRALSQGLCLPDHQDSMTGTPQDIFPAKQLLSNPFIVETKKKKKKKKK